MARTFDLRDQEQTADGGRSIVASTFVTLDGYMVGPDEDVSWVTKAFDREMQADIAEDMSRRSDVFVFGRVTYELFAAYWPNAVPYEDGDDLHPAEGREDSRIIRALDEFPKLVFSKTLTSSEWNNTRFVDEGLEDEIRELKRQPGKAVSIQGSASIVQALERADLIDEYHLYVHPVLLGQGLPATKADLLHRLGRDREAVTAYQAALTLTDNATEHEFLAERISRQGRPDGQEAV